MWNIIFCREHKLFSIIFVIRVVIPKTTIVFCKDMRVRDKYNITKQYRDIIECFFEKYGIKGQ